MVVDCQSLIEFCRAFEHQIAQNALTSSEKQNSYRPLQRTRGKSLNPLSHPFCEHSPFAAIDIVILFLAIGALGFLSVPYFKLIFHEACDLLPLTFDLVMEVVYETPVAYAVGLVLASAAVIAVWEIIDFKSRKCGNSDCKGLRKSVEFDIQLESEECVKCLPCVVKETACSLELGRDHKELEVELKKMAPLNGRTVLIFRLPCGCPAGRMEVWGPKKVRRIKK